MVLNAAFPGADGNELHPLLRAPPIAVAVVPVDRDVEALFERCRRFPVEQRFGFLCRTDVAIHLTGSIPDALDATGRHTHTVDQHHRQIADRHVAARSKVDGLTDDALEWHVHGLVDGLTGSTDKSPGTAAAAAPMHRPRRTSE